MCRSETQKKLYYSKAALLKAGPPPPPPPTKSHANILVKINRMGLTVQGIPSLLRSLQGASLEPKQPKSLKEMERAELKVGGSGWASAPRHINEHILSSTEKIIYEREIMIHS